MVPNPYNIPIHNQENKNNCTSIAFATLLEYKLSEFLKERSLIDIDDLWDKQRRLGTATEAGDKMTGPMEMVEKYGALFRTDSGRKGLIIGGLRSPFVIQFFHTRYSRPLIMRFQWAKLF